MAHRSCGFYREGGSDHHPILTVPGYDPSKMESIAATAFSCTFGRTWLYLSSAVEVEERPISSRIDRDASEHGGTPQRGLSVFAERLTGGVEEAYLVGGLKRSA